MVLPVLLQVSSDCRKVPPANEWKSLFLKFQPIWYNIYTTGYSSSIHKRLKFQLSCSLGGGSGWEQHSKFHHSMTCRGRVPGRGEVWQSHGKGDGRQLTEYLVHEDISCRIQWQTQIQPRLQNTEENVVICGVCVSTCVCVGVRVCRCTCVYMWNTHVWVWGCVQSVLEQQGLQLCGSTYTWASLEKDSTVL